MSAAHHDLVDSLVGITPGTPLDAIRARRPDARAHMQASYEALFGSPAPGDVTRAERLSIAAFVTGLHGSGPLADHFRDQLAIVHGSLPDAVAREIERGRATGPYGHYPRGPLTREDRPGPVYDADKIAVVALGRRLAQAFVHAHLLVFRPREASPDAIQKLLAAGWSPDAVVTLSQVVAFLTFQVRVVAGLALLKS